LAGSTRLPLSGAETYAVSADDEGTVWHCVGGRGRRLMNGRRMRRHGLERPDGSARWQLHRTVCRSAGCRLRRRRPAQV